MIRQETNAEAEKQQYAETLVFNQRISIRNQISRWFISISCIFSIRICSNLSQLIKYLLPSMKVIGIRTIHRSDQNNLIHLAVCNELLNFISLH